MMVLAFLSLAMLAGCEKNDIKVQRHIEAEDVIVEQDTVVE